MMDTQTAFLTGRLANRKTSKWLLDRESIVIGRDAPADILLPFPAISRQHACITRTPGGYFIADLGSRNGTCIGSEPVNGEPRRLSNGEDIVLGGAITFRFHDPEQVARLQRGAQGKGVFVDEATREVWLDGKLLQPELSDAQWALLLLLYRSPNQVISHAQIIAAAWQSVEPVGVSKAAVEGLIKRLRARLRSAQPEKEYLRVWRGKGIQLIQVED